MIRFPNAKINLGLRIVSRRPDGYHNLETVFYPIQLQDALELVPTTDPTTSLTLSGIVINGDSRDNLVMKAWRRLSERFDLPPVSIHLHKAIPFGAGLGGGSADAAFLLAMACDYFHLPLSDEELDREAAALGADCPFFLHNKPLLAKGIGDEFEQIGRASCRERAGCSLSEGVPAGAGETGRGGTYGGGLFAGDSRRAR